MKKPPSEIEVFPYPNRSSWGLITSDCPVTEATKQECSHWTIKIPTGDTPALVDVYFHGDMPATEKRHLINSQIFTFYHRMEL